MGEVSYKLGLVGEEIAASFLIQRGYTILEKNFRSQQGEIDIVARDGEFLVFIEVKSYSFLSYGSPVGAVRKNKRQSIIHAARYYLYSNNIKNQDCRFDVVAIYRRRDGSRAIELYRHAFGVN